MQPIDAPADRTIEIVVGIIVLVVALSLGYYGVKGGIQYYQGSRAASADPIACAVGIPAGIVGSYLGFRLLTGWHEERPLLPQMLLLIASLGALTGGAYFVVLQEKLDKPIGDGIPGAVLFGGVGLAGLWLWWRRGSRR